jgi:alpha-tubulin suppressor-like RCC1 family protein
LFTIRPEPPAVSPSGRPLYDAINAQISCPGSDGATVRYTLDGSEPSLSSTSISCGGTVEVGPGVTLKALVERGGVPSVSVTEIYPSLDATPASVAMGETGAFTLLRQPNGTVWTWGNVDLDGISVSQNVPLATQLPGVIASSIAAGGQQAFVIQTDGTVLGWGDDTSYQIAGTGTWLTTPTSVSGLPPVTALATGSTHSVALAEDGTVWSWGLNQYGKRGFDPMVGLFVTPLQIPDLAGVTAIAAGTNHTMALKDDGTVWEWGLSSTGTESWIPAQVPGLSGIVRIVAYESTSMAVSDTGAAWVWGDTPWGVFSATPVRLAEWVTCESGDEGTTCTPGDLFEGVVDVHKGLIRFSDGSTRRYLVPDGIPGEATPLTEPVVGPSAATAIAGGGPDRGVVVTEGGSVWTWGEGPLSGDGGDGTRTAPGDIALDGYDWRTGMPRMTWEEEPFTETTPITLGSLSPAAEIRYTLDGAAPTSASTQYVEPFSAPYGARLRAIAIAPGMPESLSVDRVLPPATVSDIQLSPGAGSF